MSLSKYFFLTRDLNAWYVNEMYLDEEDEEYEEAEDEEIFGDEE